MLNSKARTWVANLIDGRLPENREAVGFLQTDIIRGAEGVKGPMRNLEKFPIRLRSAPGPHMPAANAHNRAARDPPRRSEH